MDALAEQLKGLAPTITKLQDAAPPTVSDPEALLAKMQKQYAAHIDGGRGAKAAELLPEIGRLHTQVQATRQAFHPPKVLSRVTKRQGPTPSHRPQPLLRTPPYLQQRRLPRPTKPTICCGRFLGQTSQQPRKMPSLVTCTVTRQRLNVRPTAQPTTRWH